MRLLILLSMFLVVFAQDQKNDGFYRFSKALNLNENQIDEILSIRLETRKQMLPLRDEIKKIRSEKQLLLATDLPDRAKLNSLIDQITLKQQQLQKLSADQVIRIRSILNSQQKLRFDNWRLSLRKRLFKKSSFHLF
jgi:Spy/CpxP family protein refolding chaperone